MSDTPNSFGDLGPEPAATPPGGSHESDRPRRSASAHTEPPRRFSRCEEEVENLRNPQSRGQRSRADALSLAEGTQTPSLADQISALAGSDKIDEELEAMKAALKGDEPAREG